MLLATDHTELILGEMSFVGERGEPPGRGAWTWPKTLFCVKLTSRANRQRSVTLEGVTPPWGTEPHCLAWADLGTSVYRDTLRVPILIIPPFVVDGRGVRSQIHHETHW